MSRLNRNTVNALIRNKTCRLIIDPQNSIDQILKFSFSGNQPFSDHYIPTLRIIVRSLAVQKDNEFTQVSVPTSLFNRLQSRLEGTTFHSVSDYVTYVLEDVLRETEKSPPKEIFSESDEERVKDRLRALGYI